MKKLVVIGMLLVTILILAVCQNGLLDAEQQSVDKIVLHQMKSFGQVIGNSQFEVTDKQTIEVFAEAISRADKVSGIADVVDPSFRVEFGEKEIYLWVSADHGSVMDEADTHTLYTMEKRCRTAVQFSFLE